MYYRVGSYLLEIVLAAAMIFWLRSSSRGTPLAWKTIWKVLLYGVICALVSAFITIHYSFNLAAIEANNEALFNQYGTLMLLLNIFIGSIVEELAKYVVGVFLLIDNKTIRRMSDIIMLMVIVGLGFALIEDLLYLIVSPADAPLRLMSFYLHAGTAAVMGYSLARFRYGLAGYRELFLAVISAMSLHVCYNLATQVEQENTRLFLMAAVALVISLQIFSLVTRTIKEEYLLEQEEKSHEIPKKPTKLLNLTGPSRR
jgi:RsiW-degrading membrane proteinase PrsW (M82 family)